MSPSPDSCPRCGAPRVAGPECPACGVIYLRAEARAATRQAEVRDREAREAADRAAEDQRAAMREALEAHSAPTFMSPLVAARPAPDPTTEGITFHPGGGLSDGALEARLRLAVLPGVLVGAWFAVQVPLFHAMLRTVLTMPVHELGHAVTAWFCGYSATPTPMWVTHVSEERSTFMVLLLSGLLGALVWQGWKRRRWAWVAVGAVLLAVLGVGRFGLTHDEAKALIYFGGDAGRMVLGTLLMATFFVPVGHYLHRHQLRWGFVVIGAAALMDSFEQWWSSRTHVDRIMFGHNEGSGLSDASALVDVYGWNISRLIRWNVNVGLACLAALTALYLFSLWRARDALRG